MLGGFRAAAQVRPAANYLMRMAWD